MLHKPHVLSKTNYTFNRSSFDAQKKKLGNRTNFLSILSYLGTLKLKNPDVSGLLSLHQ